MRDAAAFVVLAFTSLALAPVAGALSADAGASTAVAAHLAAPVPATPLPAQHLPSGAWAPSVDAGGEVQSGDVAFEVPAIPAVVLQVEASASLDSPSSTGKRAGAGDTPHVDDGAALSPSRSDVDPVVVAAAAAPLAVVAVGIATGGFGLRAAWGHLGGWSARTLRAALGVASFGLFSRIERGHLLDNPVRARVHDAVAQDPGLTISEVQARAGIAWGTTVHHLRRLENNGLLVSVMRRANRHYFVANTPAAAQRSAIATILHPTARRIATLVALQPGIDQTGLCQALRLNGPSASKHLSQFRGQGLVASRRLGRRTIHHPTAGLHAALTLLEHAPVAWGSPPVVGIAMPPPSLVVAQ